MKNPHPHNKQHKSHLRAPFKLLGVTAILLIMSIFVLADCISVVSGDDDTVEISISAGSAASAASDTDSEAASSTQIIATNPGMETSDDTQVWTTQTDLEIFQGYYVDSNGEITVLTQNEDNLVAPGTNGTYSFMIKNTGDVNIDYSMYVEAWLGNEEVYIPVSVRFYDIYGTWYVGDDESWADFLELNSVSDAGELSAGYYTKYTLQWEWLYEQEDVSEGDEYDTMLGNLAVDEDLTLTVRITTYAEADDTACGGIADTGDYGRLCMWAIIAIASVFAMVLVFRHLLPAWRKRDEDKDEA